MTMILDVSCSCTLSFYSLKCQ